MVEESLGLVPYHVIYFNCALLFQKLVKECTLVLGVALDEFILVTWSTAQEGLLWAQGIRTYKIYIYTHTHTIIFKLTYFVYSKKIYWTTWLGNPKNLGLTKRILALQIKEVNTILEDVPVWPQVRYISRTGQYRCTVSSLPLFYIFNIYTHTNIKWHHQYSILCDSTNIYILNNSGAYIKWLHQHRF